MEDKELLQQIMDELNNHLDHVFEKSGLRMDYEDLKKIIVLNHGSDRKTSVFMVSYNKPSEEYPDGRITFYIDAIADYSAYIGRDMRDVITKIFFAQVHHYLSLKSRGTISHKRAEYFSSKVCKKLMKQGLLSNEPPIFYIDTEDPNMYYQRYLRSKWFERWSGIDLTNTDTSDEEIEVEDYPQED